jgi:hypothetical protein
MRKLDVFFEMEEKIMSRATLDRSLMQVSLISFSLFSGFLNPGVVSSHQKP